MELHDGDIYMVAQCRAVGNSLFSVGILLVIISNTCRGRTT